jgi:hypothetical protein
MAEFLKPPPHAVAAPSGPTWLGDDGIIISINESVIHTREEAVRNIEVTRMVGLGIPRPMLVDLTKVRSMSKEGREEYTKSETLKVVTAVGFITNSNVGRMVGNLFINLNKHVLPVKLFNDAYKAKEWLMQYRVNK